MDIKTIPINDLNPAKYNPRKDLKPGDLDYEHLKRSIEHWGLDDANERALNIALNKIGGGWDLGLLESELGVLRDMDFDIDLTGFDDDELGELFPTDPEPEDFDTAAAMAELGDVAETKVGEIIELGRHRLMCGDATKSEDVERWIEGAKVDFVFLDPPYDLEADLTNLLRMGRMCVLLHADKKCAAYATNLDIFKHFLIGIREFSTTGVLNHPLQHHTLIAVFGSARVFNHLTPYLSSVQNDFLVCGFQKSNLFMENMIATYSNDGDLVADFFGGSGVTLVTCEELNRTCYIMELDTLKCDLIIKRWESLTGEAARKIE